MAARLQAFELDVAINPGDRRAARRIDLHGQARDRRSAVRSLHAKPHSARPGHRRRIAANDEPHAVLLTHGEPMRLQDFAREARVGRLRVARRRP